MTGQGVQVVQFVHPGFEYSVGGRNQRSGVMSWKQGKSKHDRKFMLTQGSLHDPDTGANHTSVPLTFWGEWEGPSVFWRVDSPGRPMPRVVHAPFRPARWPATPVQNTDPMVFGTAFIYSNCLQAAYRSLRTLSSGSLVLFGRYARPYGRPSFGLDTCLVVDRLETLAPTHVAAADYGEDLLTDAVLGPLFTEGVGRELSVYFGRPWPPDGAGMFSFFPARLAIGSLQLFARPELSPTGALDGVISPANMQGIKVTGHLSVTDRDAIWAEVVAQVHRQGCWLGHYAAPPPLLEPAAAESAAGNAPTPLPGSPHRAEPETRRPAGKAPGFVDLSNGYVPAGTTVHGPLELERMLTHWADASDRATVGDGGTFAGSPVIIVRLRGDLFVLNRDTTRSAVREFLSTAAVAGCADKLRWHVTTNKRGTVNRVTYRSDDDPTPGWYAYLRTPASEPRELR